MLTATGRHRIFVLLCAGVFPVPTVVALRLLGLAGAGSADDVLSSATAASSSSVCCPCAPPPTRAGIFNESHTCAVCLEPLPAPAENGTRNATTTLRLHCGHHFHPLCVRQHLTALLGQASLIAELEVRDQETNAGAPALDKSASDVAENDREQDEEIDLNQNEGGNNEQPDDASPSATSQNGTHEIEVRYPCPLCRGETPLCVTVEDPQNSAARLFANATRTMDSLRDRLLDSEGELAAAALQRILGRMIDLVSLHSPPDGMSPSGGEDPGDASPGTSEGGDLVFDEEVISETGDNSNRNSRGSTSTNSFRGERTPQWITGWLQSGTSSAVRSVAGDVSPRPMSPGASGARNVSAVLATRSSYDNQPRGEPPVSSSRPPSASGAAFVPTMTGSTGSRVVPGYTTGGYTPEVFSPRSSAMLASRPQSRGSLLSVDSSAALGRGGLGWLLGRNWADWVDANAGRTTPRVTGVSIGRRPRARQLDGTAPARSLRETPRQ